MNRYKLKDLSLNKLEYGSGAAACEYDGYIRYVRITDIDDEGNLGTDIVSPNRIESKYLLNDGDLLFARTGATVGKTYLYTSNAGKCIYAGFLIRVVPNQKLIRPKYLYYYTKSPQYKGFVQSSMKVVAQPNINAKQYGNLELIVPSLVEQDTIIEKLTALSSIISLRKNELKKLDKLIKARFVEMFGDYHTNSKGFETHPGIELFKFSSGKFLPEEKRLSDGIPVYGGNGIAWYTDVPLIDYPTIIIGRVGALCGNIHTVHEPVWITDNAIYIKEQKTNKFTLEFLTEMMTIMDFYQYADFSGQPKITQKPLESLHYLTPPIEMQNVFTDFCKQVDKSKVAVQEALDKAQLLFDSLMQRYFG